MIASAIMLMLGTVWTAFALVSPRRGGRSLEEPHAPDLPRPSGVGGWIFASVCLLASASLLHWGVGVSGLDTSIATSTAVISTLLLFRRTRRTRLIGVAIAVVSIVAAVLLQDAHPSPVGVVGQALARAAATLGVEYGALAAAISALLFLGPACNALVTVIVNAAHTDEETSGVPVETPHEPSWKLSIRNTEVAEIRKPKDSIAASGFLGGRFVGPLERLLVFAAFLASMPILIASLVAVKGVVRFPEISADQDRGAKAEEFLVGTLASLLLAALSAVTVLV